MLTTAQIDSIPSRSLPISPQLDHLLNAFTSLSLSLFTLFTTKGLEANDSRCLALVQELAQLDVKFTGLIQLLVEHQTRQTHIDHLVTSLATADSAWRSTTETLHGAVVALKPIIDSGALDRQAITAATSAQLSLESVLSYARLLAPFTSAPPSTLFSTKERMEGGTSDPSGRGLPANARPPFPTEGMMRSGRLQFGRTNDGGGELAAVGGLLNYICFSLVFRSRFR